MISLQQLQERLALLEQEKKQVEGNLVQLQANLNAYEGAISDCKYWIDIIQNEDLDTLPFVDP